MVASCCSSSETPSSPASSCTAVRSVPLPAPRWFTAAAALVVGGLLTRQILRIRLLKRIRSTGEPDSEYGHSRLSSYHRRGGIMEQRYMAQPPGQKRAFTQAIRLRGPRPSIAELHAALSRVALNHPTLLVVPSPDCQSLGCQVTDPDLNPDGTLNFPLAHLAPCVSKVAGELDDILHDLMNAPSEVDLTPEEWSTRQTRSISWRAIRLLLLEDERDNDPNEFTLIIRLAHIASDGQSGLIIFRHLLHELKLLRLQEEEEEGGLGSCLPTHIPLSSLSSIATYPSMDDMLEFRPTLGHRIRHLWQQHVLSKLPRCFETHLSKCQRTWWCGRSLIDHEDDDDTSSFDTRLQPFFGSSFVRVQIDSKRISKLLTMSRQHGVTLHGLMTVACTYATGILATIDQSTSESHTHHHRTTTTPPLKIVTPFGARRLFDPKGAFGRDPFDLIGNYFAVHATFFTLDDGDTFDSIWSRSHHYLTELTSQQSSNLQDLGMLGFMNLTPTSMLKGINASWCGRTGSCIMSDLGATDTGRGATIASNFYESFEMELLDARFVQPVHYQAGVFTNNILRTEHSGLSNCIAYPNQVVKKEQAELYKKVFEYVIKQIEETGDCRYKDVQMRFRGRQQH